MSGSYSPGTTATLSATFVDVGGAPDDATPVSFVIANPSGVVVVTGVAPVHDGLGAYHYAWSIPSNAAPGVWTIDWQGTIDGEAVEATEAFVVGSVVVAPPAGAVVCQLWAQPSDISSAPGTDAEKLVALTIASDTLYAFSGRQFPGLCTDTVRPCAGRQPMDIPPVPIPGFGRFGAFVGNIYSSAFGGGNGSGVGCWCGCAGYSRVRLGAEPVVSITEVRLDGAVVDPTLYQIDEGRWLAAVPDSSGAVRHWPCSQQIDDPPTKAGTFQVVYVFGRTVPAGGKAAAMALATQILKANAGDDCQIPANTSQLIRQQTTLTLIDPAVLFDKGSTGIKSVDRWVASVNPHHLNEPGRVLSPDQPRPVAHVAT